MALGEAVGESRADTLAVLKEGQIVGQGSLSELREKTGGTLDTLEQIYLHLAAKGKDDEYEYDDDFTPYYPGMPYHWDQQSIMVNNRLPRLKHF